MRRYLESDKPIGRLERVLGLMMASAFYTAVAVSPAGAQLAHVLPMLRDPNPVHYVAGFHAPWSHGTVKPGSYILKLK